jgi:hypothetical protein
MATKQPGYKDLSVLDSGIVEPTSLLNLVHRC